MVCGKKYGGSSSQKNYRTHTIEISALLPSLADTESTSHNILVFRNSAISNQLTN